MDSARVRRVGSSSTTRTVVGLARFGFIRPNPLGFEDGNHGAKRKFQLSQLFYNCDCICGTYAAELGSRKQRPTTNCGGHSAKGRPGSCHLTQCLTAKRVLAEASVIGDLGAIMAPSHPESGECRFSTLEPSRRSQRLGCAPRIMRVF